LFPCDAKSIKIATSYEKSKHEDLISMKKIAYSFIALQAFILSSPLFADDGDAMPTPQQSMMQTMIMIGIALMFFYFILWRPVQKRRKALDEQRASIKKGDKVTAMGIIGTVVKIQDQTMILKMYDGSKIEVLKGAITDVIPGTEEDAKKADKDERSTSSKRVDINSED
jgi:preprotein translocase subunit YajC